jgi:hypothetical protein
MFDTFSTELKENARLRLGLALIVAVLWVYGLLLLRDQKTSVAQSYKNATTKLARLQSVAQQGDWLGRREAAKTLQANVESGLWRGDTLGLARATFQDYLTQQTLVAAVTRPVVTMGTVDDDIRTDGKLAGASHNLDDEVWKVKAKLIFDFNPTSFNKLMGLLASQPRHVVIESLRVTKEPIARVEAVLVAYFQKPDVSKVVANK